MKWNLGGDSTRLSWLTTSSSRYMAVPLNNHETLDNDVDSDQLEFLDVEKQSGRTAYFGPWSISTTFASLLAILGRVWIALRPRLFTPSPSPSQAAKLSPTDWLNGVRGIASLFVFFSHIRGWVFPGVIMVGWSKENSAFYLLPIIRLLSDGPTMITLFFIISGYVLSYKPLLLIRKSSPDYLKIYQSLASSVFRRALRLFTPPLVIAFIQLWTLHFHLLAEYGGPMDPGEAGTVLGLFSWWFDAAMNAMDPFSPFLPTAFEAPLSKIEGIFWTISTEYRGSLVVFVLLLVISQTRRLGRFLFLVAFLLWTIWVGRWEVYLFVMGMVCCEVRNFTRARETSAAQTEIGVMVPHGIKQRILNIVKGIIVPLLLMIVVLYFLSLPGAWFQPIDSPLFGDAPFYYTLRVYTPQRWKGNTDAGDFWRCVAASAFFLLVDHTVIFRRFFELPLLQYLADVSFSLYCIHPLMVKILAARVIHYGYLWTSDIQTHWIQLLVRLVIVSIFFGFPLFWISEISTKYLDKGSVRFARWAERKFGMCHEERVVSVVSAPALAPVELVDSPYVDDVETQRLR